MKFWQFLQQSHRFVLVWLVLLAGAIGLGVRVYRLQIVTAPELQVKARSQQRVSVDAYIPRRNIVDRRGNVLATDRLVYDLYAHPKLFRESPEAVAEQLSLMLGISVEQLVDRFERQASGIRLARNLSEEAAVNLSRLQLNGVELTRHYDRYYPHGEVAANVIGFVRKGEHSGQEGVEFTQQQLLKRMGEPIQIARTGTGAFLPDSFPDNALHFDDRQLQLTLDVRLQRAARTALQKKMTEFNGKRGAVIVMDARDGSLLALVCEPSFNPNRYYRSQLEWLKNWTVSDLYEPGSTFKPINVAIALEAGVIQPNTFIHDSGSMKVGGWTIRNHDFYHKGARGLIDISRILQVSSNVGMIKIMDRLTPQAYYEKLQELGMKQKTGIDLMGEVAGHLKSEFQFLNYPIEPATSAFGQGLSLTPIKLVQLHGAIANGGELVTPHVVRGLVNHRGQLIQEKSYPAKRVLSPSTSEQVLEMMETVVADGSGQPARIPGYRIAGKTGTAQKATARGYYSSNAKITSFVGIFPVNKPRYVILALVDEPRRGIAFGSTVAAPMVKEVIEAIVAIEGIPPTEPIPKEQE